MFEILDFSSKYRISMVVEMILATNYWSGGKSGKIVKISTVGKYISEKIGPKVMCASGKGSVKKSLILRQCIRVFFHLKKISDFLASSSCTSNGRKDINIIYMIIKYKNINIKNSYMHHNLFYIITLLNAFELNKL